MYCHNRQEINKQTSNYFFSVLPLFQLNMTIYIYAVQIYWNNDNGIVMHKFWYKIINGYAKNQKP